MDVVLEFPGLGVAIGVSLLVDTGTDRTILAPSDSRRLRELVGTDLGELAAGAPSVGVGGRVDTQIADCNLLIDDFSTPLQLTIIRSSERQASEIPSLLGRDVLSNFALFMEEKSNRILLLDEAETKTLLLP